MQPRTLDQIMAELGSVYDPQVNSIRQRQSLLPEQLKSEEAGLEAKKVNAFDSILSGARGRGLGFSGIPLGEQAKYTASEFLPAVARARAAAKEQAMSLEDAILGIRERQQSSAMAQRQYEQQRWDNYQAELRAAAEARANAARAAAEARANAARAAAAQAQPTWYLPQAQQVQQRPPLSSFFNSQPLRVSNPVNTSTVKVSNPVNKSTVKVSNPVNKTTVKVSQPKTQSTLRVR